MLVVDISNNPEEQPPKQHSELLRKHRSHKNAGRLAKNAGRLYISLMAAMPQHRNNSDLDGFSDVNPNNYKIATISGGRTYAEHDNISTSNTFNVKWTAPATGTGSVTLYAAGNGVNATGTTGGDGSGFGTAKLTEFSSSTNSPEAGFLRLAVSPNPLQPTSTLQIDGIEAGSYTLRAFDLSGRQVWNSRKELPSGSATLLLQTSEWQPGIYFLQLEGANKVANVKVLKP
jgi:hypothetical protein